MATSPLFGWEEPDDTDLVKDGAAAIRTLGNAIDTSMGDLLGGTTGQVLAKASNTDMDFTWVAQDDSNAIQNAIVDAKGDLIAATAADTPARLAVGTNGQVLTADSTAATGLAWATAASGSMTSIASGSLSGASLNLTSISSSYKSLYLILDSYSLTAAGSITLRVNSDSGTNYNYVYIGSENGTFRNAQLLTQGVVDLLANGSYSCASGNNKNLLVVSIPNYASANTGKVIETFNTWLASTALTRALMKGFISYTGTNAAISTVTIGTSSTFNGGTYTLYGVN